MSSNNIQNLLDGYKNPDARPLDVKVDYEDEDILFIETLDKLPQIYSGKSKINIICSCIKGRMEIDVSGSHYILRPGQVFVCPSGVFVDNVLVSPDFKFSVLCLTDRIIQQLLNTNVDLWNRAVYVNKEHIIESISEAHSSIGRHFMVITHTLLQTPDFPFRDEMVRTMLQLVLLGFCARQKAREETETRVAIEQKSPQAKVLFARFMEALKTEEVKHQPVYYYAEKLCISSKYLSHICKEVTGKSANEFIQGAVINEITRYLTNTTLSVKEISNKLGFPNISFFGKYVKAHFGVSPNEYRKQMIVEKK